MTKRTVELGLATPGVDSQGHPTPVPLRAAPQVQGSEGGGAGGARGAGPPSRSQGSRASTC